MRDTVLHFIVYFLAIYRSCQPCRILFHYQLYGVIHSSLRDLGWVDLDKVFHHVSQLLSHFLPNLHQPKHVEDHEMNQPVLHHPLQLFLIILSQSTGPTSCCIRGDRPVALFVYLSSPLFA